MPFNNFTGSLSTIPLQHLVDTAQTYADLEPILTAGGQTATVALSCANTVMNTICSTPFPHKWNEYIIPPFYSNSFQQDYAVTMQPGLSGTLTLTAVTSVSTSQGTTTYAGTMPDGAFGGYVGVPFVVTGFTNAGNNGTFMCVASSASSFVLQNAGGVLETHAATAISAGGPLLNMAWLQRGVAFDINNSAIPKPYARIECGRQLPQITATYTGGAGLGDPGFRCNWFPNRTLYYGTWGQANVGGATTGNNPGPGSVYYQPTGSVVTAASWSSTSGGQAVFTVSSLLPTVKVGGTVNIANAFPTGYNGSWVVVSINTTNLVAPTITVTMTTNPGTYESGGDVNNSNNTDQPDNPITQIVDANGNFLLLTTYGTEGTTPPLAARNAVPGTTVSGTGATSQWTVLDPNGWGFRMTPVPSETGTEWQFNLIAQMKPVRFVSLAQTLAPLPDEFETFFRDGFIAQLYRRSPEKSVYSKFTGEWQLWQKALTDMRVKEDRELEENKFIPTRTVFGAARSRNNFQGGAWPYNYPRP
jgi:hypothetical protein